MRNFMKPLFWLLVVGSMTMLGCQSTAPHNTPSPESKKGSEIEVVDAGHEKDLEKDTKEKTGDLRAIK